MKKTNLTVLILTFDINVINLNIKSNTNCCKKYMPRVCQKINGKSLIEIVIENCLRLDPDKIILYVHKKNINYINDILKRKPYHKLLAYYTVNNKIQVVSDLLVVPGNCPLISGKTLLRIVGQNRDIKINDEFFYSKTGNINLPVTKDFIVSSTELKKVENQKDLDEVIKLNKRVENIIY